MSFMLTYRLEGDPKGKGRPRFRSTGKFVQTYTDAKTRDYEDQIRIAARNAMGNAEILEGPIRFMLVAAYPIPKSMPKDARLKAINGDLRPTKKPDLDNAIKVHMDALNGIIYKDDSQITKISASKIYSEFPMVEVIIMEDLV
jgi:Holliday junction resolvase RusA-like endonuclease